ncbi:uncharacterized protein EI90DRAFT_2833823, partial [Cantharellus anzutake]|uniref:uncharacterized protein n=1 Tax=Cantharellus anzutake TaxID=1750568 RepID=UPI0019086D96
RPERPLTVKCEFNGKVRRITFHSARNFSFSTLRERVEQAFSLSASNFNMTYKDDDGETIELVTDEDLTEAISYFQGGEDHPSSSGNTTWSGHSGRTTRKITLRIVVFVEYDGPSLSDTSSLASVEEFARTRDRSHQAVTGAELSSINYDIEDDMVTISSRDTALAASQKSSARGSRDFRAQKDTATASLISSQILAEQNEETDTPAEESVEISLSYASSSGASQTPVPSTTSEPHSPPRSGVNLATDVSVFERLRKEAVSKLPPFPPTHTPNLAVSFGGNPDDRGARWLQDQNDRAIRTMMGHLPRPSIPSSASDEDIIEGATDTGGLALHRHPSGKFYYSYSSDISSIPEPSTGVDAIQSMESGHPVVKDSECASQPSPLASQDRPGQKAQENAATWSEANPFRDPSDVSPELLQAILQSEMSACNGPTEVTCCSSCNEILDSFRYVCATCGERPKRNREEVVLSSLEDHSRDELGVLVPSSTSIGDWSPLSSPSNPSQADSNSPVSSYHILPRPARTTSSASLASSPSIETGPGYELCPNCIGTAGVLHAENALNAAHSPSATSLSSPNIGMGMRNAPKRKALIRHAYIEKFWGDTGWQDVELDDECSCAICQKTIDKDRFKCLSCEQFNLCRSCYSSVHEIHPSHAFAAIPDRKPPPLQSISMEEQCTMPVNASRFLAMKHPGVKCNHCLQDIVGARFHCALCDNVDICSNCESAGLPGNLTAPDGEHDSSHIMIKIPMPVETKELRNVSRRARALVMGRDASVIGVDNPCWRPRANSAGSNYQQTVIGFPNSTAERMDEWENMNHHILCRGCDKSIIGVRYQCASCPSQPSSSAYNLCEDCEAVSFTLHDAMHIFVKIPRPVDRPIENSRPLITPIYEIPAGQDRDGNRYGEGYRDYLSRIKHNAALCDRCVDHIYGTWYRCANCDADLCEFCEQLSVHDSTHVFLVIKSAVDMTKFR